MQFCFSQTPALTGNFRAQTTAFVSSCLLNRRCRLRERSTSGRHNLVQIYDFDESQGLMSCRIVVSPMKYRKKEGWWIYEGWVVNIKNKLFWLFECVEGMPPELVTLSIFKPSFRPEPEHFVLYGILSALSLEGAPCASKCILNKIKADDQRRDHIGYFTAEEIRAENHGMDILGAITMTLPPSGMSCPQHRPADVIRILFIRFLPSAAHRVDLSVREG